MDDPLISTTSRDRGCRQFREELPQHFDSQQSDSVEAHARECAECDRLLAQLKELLLAAQEMPQAEPSPQVWSSLRASLLAEGLVHEPVGATMGFDPVTTAARDLPEIEPSPRVWANVRAMLVAEGLIAPSPALAADFAAIESLAKVLPQLEPDRRVWANIRATLAAEGLFERKRSAWQRWLSRAAWNKWLIPAGALGGLALVLMAIGIRRGVERQSAPSVAAVTMTAPVAVGGQTVALVRLEGQMERNYDAERASLDPSLQAAFDKGIRSADEAISASQSFVESDPENTLARQYLESAYETKARVLTAALELNDH